MRNNLSKTKYFIGIDEAGRGPIAGPVAVGVVAIKIKNKNSKFKIFKGIRDSKQLSEKAREVWFKKISQLKKEKALDFHVSLISEKVIDKKGIVFAVFSGIRLSLKKIKAKPSSAYILLDGSLKAPVQFKNQKTIIKGDETVPVISSASIMAKVTRDRYMKRISKKYPKYAFEKHKGYGTKAHYKKIKKHGLSKIHRRSFLKKIIKIS
ncbi:MAG: ribonuclease HII [Patescibacteria group bacterium]